MIRKVMLMGLLAVFLCATSNAFAGDVYVTKNGKKYHKQDCRLIKGKNAVKISKEEAIKKGYTPCKRCYKEDIVVKDTKKKDTAEKDTTKKENNKQTKSKKKK